MKGKTATNQMMLKANFKATPRGENTNKISRRSALLSEKETSIITQSLYRKMTYTHYNIFLG